MILWLIFIYSYSNAVKVAMVDTAISEEFKNNYYFAFTYLDFTNDTSMFNQKRGSHAEKLLNNINKRWDLTLTKVYKNNGETEIKFIERALNYIYRSNYDIVLFAMAIHIINPQTMDSLQKTTILINSILEQGTDFVAAVSNLAFLESYPSCLKNVKAIYPQNEISSSLMVINYLNSHRKQ